LRLDRGIVFISVAVSLVIVLTLALATVVYNGTPSQDQAPGSDNPVLDTYLELSVHGNDDNGTLSDNGSGNGVLLGGELDSGAIDANIYKSQKLLGSAANSIVGVWQEPGSDNTYVFDGSQCFINCDFDNPVPYYSHWETVYTPSNAPVRTLVYSMNDAPGEGFAFITDSLRFVVRGNTRWESWYALTRSDPILGRWKSADDCVGYRFEFDSANYRGYYLVWGGYKGEYTPYKKIMAWIRVFTDSTNYQDIYTQLYRLPFDQGHSEVTLRGYAFINDVLYDIRSDSPGEEGLVTDQYLICVRG
jgi:hypothetical protein